SALVMMYRFISYGRRDGPHGRLKLLACFGAAAMLALGIAAVQTLPTLEWIRYVHNSRIVFWGARPLREFPALLSRSSFPPTAEAIALPEGAAYAGGIALVLSFFSLARTRKLDVLLFWLLVAISLQVAYGFGPVYSILSYLPVIHWLKNCRVLFVMVFFLAVLAVLVL